MSVQYRYICSLEQVHVHETLPYTSAAPTVCKNDGSSLVAGSLVIVKYPASHTELSEIGTHTHAQIDTHVDDVTTNPHQVTKTQVGLSNVPNLKVNLTATSGPTVNNDATEGYAVGSRWIDTVSDKEYVLVDATDGAAVWIETTQSGTAVTYYNASETVSSTTSTSYIEKVRLTISDAVAGSHVIWYSAELRNSSTRRPAIMRVQVDDTTIVCEARTARNDGDNTIDDEENDWQTISGHVRLNLTSGAHTIDIDYKRTLTGTVFIRRARIFVMRV